MANQVTIQFRGVCTHLTQGTTGVQHRVVLISEENDVTINGHTVISHQPSLHQGSTHFPSPKGRRLRIANGIGGAPSYDRTYNLVPNLAGFAGTAAVVLDPVVTQDGGYPASVYFDVDQGAFSAAPLSEGGAIAATVVVQTDGPPRLEFLLFDGSPSGTPDIPLSSEVSLVVSNETADLKDHQDADFLLNYLVFVSVPDGVTFPQAVIPRPEELGPGCSNSSYP